MPTTYSEPELFDDVRTLLAHVSRKWHQPLVECEVRILVLFASNPDGPALKKSGAPVAARIRVLSLMWRVATSHDVLLEIDETTWNELEEDSRAALIDHELAHVAVVDFNEVENEDGTKSARFKRDDIGRPKLTTIDGDWQSGDGFLDVVKRHGEAAIEAINSRRVFSLVTAAIGESMEEAHERDD